MSERIYCQHGRRIDSCDSCDVIEAEAEIEKIKRQRDQLLAALMNLFDDYKRLADSGDAGSWRLEDLECGKQALAAITAAQQPEGE